MFWLGLFKNTKVTMFHQCLNFIEVDLIIISATLFVFIWSTCCIILCFKPLFCHVELLKYLCAFYTERDHRHQKSSCKIYQMYTIIWLLLWGWYGLHLIWRSSIIVTAVRTTQQESPSGWVKLRLNVFPLFRASGYDVFHFHSKQINTRLWSEMYSFITCICS